LISVPAGLQYYHTQVDLRPEGNALLVDVEAKFDIVTGRAAWAFTAIDPAPGEPTQDPWAGFLPPNDPASHSGEGSVQYDLLSKKGLPSGTEITNVATIVFDWNEPMDTPIVRNVIDSLPPDSSVAVLPPVTQDPSIALTWSGADDATGSGLSQYDVYVSDNGGPYVRWLSGTQSLSATYPGQHGHSYRFYSTATDNVGHVEEAPLTADAATFVNTAPTVAAGLDATADEGFAFTQTGSFTDGDPGDTWAATVDYGDGGGVVPLALTPDGTFDLVHTYADEGTYSVTVVVTDAGDATGQGTLTVTVKNVAPVADAGPDRTVDEGQTVSFVGVFSDPGTADTHTLAWDFGDGSTAIGALTPTHVYADDGTYTVTLTVTDDDGVGTDFLTVTVKNVAPTLTVVTGDTSGKANQALSYSALATDPGTSDVLAFTWDFGDGSVPATGSAVSHVFAAAGTYTVTVGVSDGDGSSDSRSMAVTIVPAVTLKMSQVTVNNGAAQRSNIETLSIQFSGASNIQALIDAGTICQAVQVWSSTQVTLAANRFRYDASTFRLTVDLTIDGFGGSAATLLADGTYQLKMNTGMISAAGDPNNHLLDDDGMADGIRRYDFFRLQGDFDGNRVVDLADRTSLMACMNTKAGCAGYDRAYDLNGDGVINISDYTLWTRLVGRKI
jgi:PKD repeat protein